MTTILVVKILASTQILTNTTSVNGLVVACGGYTVYNDPTGKYRDDYYVDIDSIEFTAERFDEETDTNYVYEADEQSLEALSQAIYKNCGRPRPMQFVPRREIARAKA